MSGDNVFEEVIDKMMLEEVRGIKPTLYDKIQTLKSDQKRIVILAALNKDKSLRGLLLQIQKSIQNNKITEVTSKLKQIESIIKWLRDYVKVGEVEKKKFGEVMTPLSLCKEMIETIPVDFWKNSNSKILDSCNGTGPYLIMVIYRLMIGLKDEFPDEEQRYKHIIENMVYAGELQPKNMFLWMCVVDPQDIYSLNVYTGSFLEKEFDNHMKNEWGIEKWDLILGNPPYQILVEGNRSRSLWNLFVEKSLNMLQEGGYLSMIHPSGWRNLDGAFKSTQNMMKKYDMIFLKMRNFKSGQDVFGAGIDYDFYCIRKTFNQNIQTKIICQDDFELFYNIKKMEFIPGKNIIKIYSLVAKEDEKKVELLHNCSYHIQKNYVSNETTNKFVYPCVYTVKLSNLPTLKWSSINNKGCFGSSKVIWASGASGVFIDANGEYGLTQFSSAIVDEIENLENIKNALTNQKFIEDIMGFRYSRGDKYNYKIISTFRKDFWKEFIDEN